MSHSAKRLLWVIGAGGAAFEHVLPRMAAQADVYAFVATEMTALQQGMLSQWCADVTTLDLAHRSDNITAAIMQAARHYGVDGVITFSELAVIAVAEACQGLGLPGPGPNARFARDKWLMRQRWDQAGLPVPRFARVENIRDLEAATRALTLPILLKPSGRGGGIGQQVIDATTSLPEALKNVDMTLERAARHGIVEYSSGLDVEHCVAEEIIDSTTDSWYADPRYGDYLSVEGIVAGGFYHPMCITGRLPTLPGYAETVAVSPCALREDLQRKVEKLAVAAIDALGLETCGTHTEIKLMAGERMCLLETAARPVGSTATAIAEDVFGIDLIGLQTSEALGLPQTYPERMLVDGKGAAAVVYLLTADSAGRPWASEVPFAWKSLDWTKLVSPASHVKIMPSQMAADGTMISPYRPGGGALNNAGSIMLYSPDPQVLLDDSYRLMDGLEAALVALSAG